MKLKIYLDTSVISALFDANNPERQGLTTDFFAQAARFDIYISNLTIAEITRTDDLSLRAKMQAAIPSFTILPAQEDMNALAQELMHNHAVPPNSQEDAYHIAAAVIAGMDYLVSWNFRHLVRLKTRDVVRMTTTLKGYKPLDILAPPELL